MLQLSGLAVMPTLYRLDKGIPTSHLPASLHLLSFSLHRLPVSHRPFRDNTVSPHMPFKPSRSSGLNSWLTHNHAVLLCCDPNTTACWLGGPALWAEMQELLLSS